MIFIPLSALAQDPPPSGESWQTTISGNASNPPLFVAVDKKRQQLVLFEHSNPLRAKSTFVCSTGQIAGDKQTKGDLRTPDGVYFVVQHLTGGLDYLLYGNEAFTLNYPNPVDRIRGKTGFGIWIHGRGEALSPLQTQGCVAMNNDDLALLGRALSPGTPILLTDGFSQAANPAPKDAQAVEALTKRVQAWAKAWGERSPAMFDFYDANAYGLAQGEPFSAFKTQKEHLFKSLPWIKTSVRDIQVLEGPGYWVTSFYQDYSAPNLNAKGVRRLYWDKDDKGEYRILGMEWVPGMSSGSLAAIAESPVPPVDAKPVSEDQASPRAVSKPQPQAETGQTGAPRWDAADAASPAQAAAQAAQTAAPAKTQAPAQTTAQAATPTQEQAQAQTPSQAASPAQAAAQAAIQTAVATQTAVPVQKAVSNGSADTTNVSAATVPAAEPPPQPANETPTPMPQVQALFEKPAPAAPAAPTSSHLLEDPIAALANKLEAWRNAWEKGDPRPRLGFPAETPVQSEQASAQKPDTQNAPTPAQEPATTRDANASVAMAPAKPAPSAEPPVSAPRAEPPREDPAAILTNRVEAWRKAWEKANLNAYMGFYANDAVQGDRRGASAIREQKQGLWAALPPEFVRLANIRVNARGDKARVDMRQTYKVPGRDGDTGVKTLYLKLVKGDWLIYREDFTLIPGAAPIRANDSPPPAATARTPQPLASPSNAAAPKASAPAARQGLAKAINKQSPVRIDNFQAKPAGRDLRLRYDLISPDQRQLSGRAKYKVLTANGAWQDLDVQSDDDSRFTISRMKVMQGSARLPQGLTPQMIRAVRVILETKDHSSYSAEYPLAQ